MTPDDLDRKIALSIEKEPVPYRWNDSHNFPAKVSKERVWVFRYRGASGDFDEKQPRSMLEPEMTLLLLERMGRTGNRDVQLWIGADDKWHCQTYLNISVIHELLSEAVRLAYARAVGLE